MNLGATHGQIEIRRTEFKKGEMALIFFRIMNESSSDARFAVLHARNVSEIQRMRFKKGEIQKFSDFKGGNSRIFCGTVSVTPRSSSTISKK